MKLSRRNIAALTNIFLVAVVVCIAAVCFIPDASAASHIEENVHDRGSSEHGISLMFNVYWGEEYLSDILDVLDEYGAKVTFFLGGSWADDNVPLVKELAERGHEIASHGYFHRDYDKLSYEENMQEISTSVQFLSLASGQQVRLFAPPSGAYSGDTLNAARSLGVETVLWSRDTVDWRDHDSDVCFRRATEDVAGGELILMHPTQHTLAALPRILAYYREHGLSAITVGENIAL